PPRPREGKAGARRCGSRLAALAATVRLGLDGIEHDGTLARSGPFSCGLGGCFCHLPYFEVAPVMEHAPGDARELVSKRDRHGAAMAPRLVRPTRWKVFLPMSMPRMATVSLDWRGMGRAPCLGQPLARRRGTAGAPPVHPINSSLCLREIRGWDRSAG